MEKLKNMFSDVLFLMCIKSSLTHGHFIAIRDREVIPTALNLKFFMRMTDMKNAYIEYRILSVLTEKHLLY